MRYLLRRLPQLVLLFWGAVTLNFFIPRMMPGDPVQVILQQYSNGGQLTPQLKAQVEAALGAPHGSFLAQYWQYLKDVFGLHFGLSYSQFPQPVSSLVLHALPWTVTVVGLGSILAFVIGSVLGVYAAWHRDQRRGDAVTLSSTFVSAFPYFWTGMLLLFIVAFKANLLPIGGGSSVPIGWNGSFLLDAVKHGILPLCTIVVGGVGAYSLGMRNNTILVLREDYIVFAQANGVPTWRILVSYAARNSVLPSLTALGISLGFVLSGSVLMETVFSYPGVGYLLFTAVSDKDYPLMQALFLMITVAVLVVVFLLDIVYLWVDPRVRRNYGRS